MNSEVSPCLECKNHLAGIDKKLCLDNCPRLRAFQAGKDWTKKEYYIVPEGKDLVDDIESNNFIETDTSSDINDIEQKEIEEVTDDDIESPVPVKHVSPEPDWKKTVMPKMAIAKCAICGKPESSENKLMRGVCRNPCYNQWYRGHIEHPTLGKFKIAPWSPKEKEETSGRRHAADRSVVADDDICLTTINIDLEQYSQIKKEVYRMANSLALPVSHVVVTLLAEALENKRSETK